MNQAISQVLAADVPWLWLSARTFGICAWVASSAVVLIGLTMSTRLFGSRVSMRSMTTIHRAAATFTLVLCLAISSRWFRTRTRSSRCLTRLFRGSRLTTPLLRRSARLPFYR